MEAKFSATDLSGLVAALAPFAASFSSVRGTQAGAKSLDRLIAPADIADHWILPFERPVAVVPPVVHGPSARFWPGQPARGVIPSLQVAGPPRLNFEIDPADSGAPADAGTTFGFPTTTLAAPARALDRGTTSVDATPDLGLATTPGRRIGPDGSPAPATRGSSPGDDTHDAQGQLTGVDRPGTAHDRTLTFDGDGNRTNAGYSHDDANEKLTGDGFAFTFDDEGNLTRKVKASNNET